MTQQPEHPTTNEPPRFCRKCSYELRGLTTVRCPECGRPFDPADPKTYLSRPIRHWLRHIIVLAKRAAIVLVMLALVLAGVWGWLYWGWHSEQRELVALKSVPEPRFRFIEIPPVACKAIISPWLREHLGAAGFVLDRVERLSLQGRTDITDFSPLSGLTYLNELNLDAVPIKDLSPLIGLTNLNHLSLAGVPAKDISPLATLKNLRQLDLHSARMITDFTPLTGLTNLEMLNLNDTRITDLSPLAGLMKLNSLYALDTPIDKLTPLAGLKSLRNLGVPMKTITAVQDEEFRRALPSCQVTRD